MRREPTLIAPDDYDTIGVEMRRELRETVAQLAEAEQQAARLRKQRDELITKLTQPPHNHTYQAVADVAGLTRQAIGWIRARQQ